MWKKLLLYQLLRTTTNSEDSLRQAAKYFNCFPGIKKGAGDVWHETVHFFGPLTRREGAWFIRNGFEEVRIDIGTETVGHRILQTLDPCEPVHNFAAVPDPNVEYDEDEMWDVPAAMLITTDDIYKMAYAVDSIRGKHKVLNDFLFLPIDQKVTVSHFMQNEVFSKNLACCLGYMASAKITPCFFSERNDDLIEEFNSSAEKDKTIDLYRVLTFLDLVGDEIQLTENSAASPVPPSWLNFLAAYGISKGCSVWNIPGKSLAKIIFEEVSLPVYMLCWILDPEQQNKLVEDLLKMKGKKKQVEIRRRLIQYLSNGEGLKLQTIYSALHHLMKDGLDDEELETLTTGNYAAVVENFLRSEYNLIP